MDFIDGMAEKEEAIIKLLRVQQSGINNRTGKGSGVEHIVEKELLYPNLPRNFDICKGSVISSDKLDKQSPAIDRIIYDTSISGSLIYSPDHSIFPLETVCGLVEITLNMDARKQLQEKMNLFQDTQLRRPLVRNDSCTLLIVFV
jgi:hypothetical protein